MTLLFISLAAGVLTVLAPCVLPLLPIIVGGSISGALNLKRALTVTIALGISVLAFTFLLKASTLLISIPPSVWMWISGSIIVLFGFITLFPSLWDRLKITSRINRESNKIVAVGYQKQSFWGDLIIGAALGPVFSSCSPTYFLILATVLPERPIVGVFYLLAYVFGLCFTLLLIAILGQKLIAKLGFATDSEGWFRRSLGIIFIAVGILIFFGFDTSLEAMIVNSGFFDITKVEQALLEHNQPQNQLSQNSNSQNILTTNLTASSTSQIQDEQARIALKSKTYPQAPEIKQPSGFVNTGGQPITFGQFKGKKVVLVDIWTYSCINCQRTLPYIKAWYDKYSDQGLEIIGIHTPEFSFEKVQKNVEDAVKSLGIKYPVVLDNNYATWNAFGNQYWPRKYLIDLDGFVVYDHIGEGNYDETEKAIQKALAERNQILHLSATVSTGITAPKDVIALSDNLVQSPETYFGSNRNEFLANGSPFTLGSQTLHIPNTLELNALYLDGTWNIQREYAESTSQTAKIIFQYNAKNVYLVGSSVQGVRLKILRDGQPLGSEAGGDVGSDSTVYVKENRLYKLINGLDYGKHTLEIDIEGPGLQAYTFTFG